MSHPKSLAKLIDAVSAENQKAFQSAFAPSPKKANKDENMRKQVKPNKSKAIPHPKKKKLPAHR